MSFFSCKLWRMSYGANGEGVKAQHMWNAPYDAGCFYFKPMSASAE